MYTRTMTKREFDKATQRNFGGGRGVMASDERASYRRERMKDNSRAPVFERRAAYLRERGMSPLWIGSPLRAPALWRAGLWK